MIRRNVRFGFSLSVAERTCLEMVADRLGISSAAAVRFLANQAATEIQMDEIVLQLDAARRAQEAGARENETSD